MKVNLGRLCIPFGMKCNFNCRYCYRDECRKDIVNKPTERFIDYIKRLSPKETYVVTASGGEPLLYLDTIKEVFSVVPNGIHKKIMTNGSLLTKDVVMYLNENNVEVSLSHDGTMTEYLRGYDIFKDVDKLKLCKAINNLVITSVITNKNTDIMEVYRYEMDILQRPFYFKPCVIQPTPVNEYLYRDFDFDKFQKGYMEYLATNAWLPNAWYKGTSFYPRCHVNVLLDGTVIGTKTMNRYGTVWDNKEKIIDAFYKAENEHLNYCINKECDRIGSCFEMVSNESDFTCKINKIKKECQSIMNYGGISQYVRN